MKKLNIQRILYEEFVNRKNKNNSYFIRAFARDLGINKTTLADSLNGNRTPSQSNLEKITEALNLRIEDVLVDSFSSATNNFQVINENEFSVISDWEFLAILNLANISENNSTPEWISQRLGISEERAINCLILLFELDLLITKQGKLIRTSTTTTDIPSDAIRKHHRQSIDMAKEALSIVPLEMREYLSGTIAIDKDKITEAKDYIFEFYQKFMKNVEDGNQDEHYKINIQFFPCRNYSNENNVDS